MRTFLISIVCSLLWFQSGQLQAQSCGTPDNFPDAIAGMPSNSNPGPFTVRVFAHIIRRADGTGGMTNAELNAALTLLSQDLQPHNICISLAGTDQILNNNFYNNSLFSNANSIAATNAQPNAIDLYFCPNTSPSPGGTALAIPSGNLVIGGTWSGGIVVNTSHILSHEFGHCLGLFHTHHGSIEGNCDECVSGSNCTTCGDFVCDTPADPFLNFNVNPSTCTWNGSALDPCGSGLPYNPDELNIMAYTYPSCMSYFTAGQGQRMRDYIATQPVLQAATVPNDVFVQNKAMGSGQVLYAGPYSITAGQAVTSGTQGPVTVSGTADVEFRAKDYIRLEPGFDAWPSSSGKFFTKIQPNLCGIFDYPNSSLSNPGSGNRTEQAYRPFLLQSEWLATTAGFEGYINGYYHAIGDTAVNGLIWNQISELFVQLEGVNNDPNIGNSGAIYLVNEDIAAQRVYLFDPILGEQLFYDFALNLGASLPGDDSFTVSSIDSILLQDGHHERFHFQNPAGQKIVWVEGVGNIANPFQPKALLGAAKALVCSRQENKVVFDQGDILGIQCRKITASAVPLGVKESSVRVFPNPTSSDFTLQFDETFDSEMLVTVMDLTGRNVLQVNLLKGKTSHTFSLENYPSGIYLVRASIAGKSIWTGKVVKE